MPLPLYRCVFLALVGPALLAFSPSGHAGAQTPFPDCATRTSTNASLVLPSDLHIVVNDTPRSAPWQIALFTADGDCVGSALWTGEASTLTVWGTDTDRPFDLLPPEKALSPGDSMYVRLFHPSTTSAYSATNSQIGVSFREGPPPYTDHATYVPGGIYVLDQIRIQRTLVSRQD